jgi:hypothetical protein
LSQQKRFKENVLFLRKIDSQTLVQNHCLPIFFFKKPILNFTSHFLNTTAS